MKVSTHENVRRSHSLQSPSSSAVINCVFVFACGITLRRGIAGGSGDGAGVNEPSGKMERGPSVVAFSPFIELHQSLLEVQLLKLLDTSDR